MGAPNSSNCIPCDTSKHKFGADVLPIMNKWCNNCHNSAITGGGFILTTYTGVVNSVAGGKLMGSINHSSGYIPMQTADGFIPPCQVAKIQNWINAGKPNN